MTYELISNFSIHDKYEIIPQLSSNLSLNLSSNGYRNDRIGLNLLFVASWSTKIPCFKLRLKLIFICCC